MVEVTWECGDRDTDLRGEASSTSVRSGRERTTGTGCTTVESFTCGRGPGPSGEPGVLVVVTRSGRTTPRPYPSSPCPLSCRLRSFGRTFCEEFGGSPGRGVMRQGPLLVSGVALSVPVSGNSEDPPEPSRRVSPRSRTGGPVS